MTTYILNLKKNNPIISSYLQYSELPDKSKKPLSALFKISRCPNMRSSAMEYIKNQIQDLGQDFYEIIKEAEDNITNNKKKIIMEINKPVQQNKVVLSWMKRQNQEEYKSQLEDWQSHYSLRSEKILVKMVDLLDTHTITDTSALIMARICSKYLLYNEIETAYAYFLIQKLGWKLNVNYFKFFTKKYYQIFFIYRNFYFL